MVKKVKHLYIHIPFCKSICAYCDFIRFVSDEITIDEYVDKIVAEMKRRFAPFQFKTIYIGGGTPNCLNNNQLTKLLSLVSTLLDFNSELTIECNPELITSEQIKIFKQFRVNRVSLGVQTTNDGILKRYNRRHTLKDVIKAINLLRENKINNISIDLIYGFNELTNEDILKTIDFINEYKIPHVSWYSLEVKNNSIINKQGYQLNDDLVDGQLKLIIDCMSNYSRYEVSSWALKDEYQSGHNKAYWLCEDWEAIGLGAFGFVNKFYFSNVGNLKEWKTEGEKYRFKEYYLQVLLMGLRLTKGIDINKQPYKGAYQYFKNRLKYVKIIDGYLSVENINLLDDTLIELID